MRIFLLEDEGAIGIGLEYSLKQEGYEVVWSRTQAEAMRFISEETFDLFLLDVNLPDGNGYDVCRKIKSMGDYPVIFLTVIEEEVNVVMGLELGADDYITKPFRLKELLARVKSVLRRYYRESADSVLRYRDLVVNTSEAKVFCSEKEVVLTAMEYRLLLVLMKNRGTVLSRNNLLENLWDIEGNFVDDNTLSVYVKRLRDKLEADVSHPQYIKTVRGRGYMIENE